MPAGCFTALILAEFEAKNVLGGADPRTVSGSNFNIRVPVGILVELGKDSVNNDNGNGNYMLYMYRNKNRKGYCCTGI